MKQILPTSGGRTDPDREAQGEVAGDTLEVLVEREQGAVVVDASTRRGAHGRQRLHGLPAGVDSADPSLSSQSEEPPFQRA